MFRKFFYRKPPDGLLEISERVYVFDCCFTTDVLEEDQYKVYLGGVVAQLREHFPDASFMVFNFREGEHQSQISDILSKYDMTVMDYPRHYEGCPLLTMEMIHHFLRSSESWLSLGQQNVLLMHCERGGWPVLAFMLAGLLIYRKQYTGEQKTLDMIYKQAPRELLQLLSPLNPLPSQLRYLQYISRRNVGTEWPPLDRMLTLDCVILRVIPNFDGEGGCRPIFRIYGQDPFIASDRTPKVLFSTPKKSKVVRLYKADCELVKIDIHCHIQGDVLECISLDEEMEGEEMMFRVMFNTAFIRSNILMLNHDEIDILWDAKDHFPKGFRVEVLLSEMDLAASLITMESASVEEKEGLPVEAFAKVKEIFSNIDWPDGRADAALHVLQHIASSNALQEKLDTLSPTKVEDIAASQTLCLDFLKENSQSHEVIDEIRKSSPSSPKQQLITFLKSSSDSNTKWENVQIHLPDGRDAAALHVPQHTASSNALQEKLDTFSQINAEASPLPQKSSLGTLKESSPSHEVDDKIRKSVPSSPMQKPVPFLEHPPDSGTKSQNVEFHDPQVALQYPSHPKIITHRRPKSWSTTAPSGNSLQGSPRHISRYHSAPSALGITALLHDHAAFGSPEVTHSATVPHTLSLSTGSASGLFESLRSKIISPTPSPPLAQSSHLRSSGATIKVPITPSFPPPLSITTTPTATTVANVTQPQPSPTPPPPPSTSTAQPVQPPKEASIIPLAPTQPSTPPPPPPPPLPLESGSRQVSSRSSHSPYRETSSSSKGLVTSVPPPPPPPNRSEPSLPAGSSSYVTSTSVSPTHPLPSGNNPSMLSATPSPPPPPPPPLPAAMLTPQPPPPPMKKTVPRAATPPPPPPPPRTGQPTSSSVSTSAPPPPPPPYLPSTHCVGPTSQKSSNAPPVPPPPLCSDHGSLKGPTTTSCQSNSLGSKGNNRGEAVPPPPANVMVAPPGAPLGIKGRSSARNTSPRNTSSKRTNLKPLHWVKVTRAMQGSLWADAQKFDEASKAPEFDMSELESLFSAVPSSDIRGSADKTSARSSLGQKSDRIQLIDLRRANNCEIMLTKVKMPLTDLMSSILALDDSVLDIDQIDNLIKFCPTKEEMELLKGFSGDKESLGKCEQYFLELMKVPRVESKLRVFSFKIQFRSQVTDLSNNLNIVNSAAAEIRNSVKLKRTMQTILSLGNALNQGTARGSAIGFRLDSLLKLTDTRARNNKMTLMHYLCKVLAEKLIELLDFPKDLVSLEAASKIQLKSLAEEMQAISKGLEKVEQELTASENDGPISETFHKTLKEFLVFAEAEVRILTSLYSHVGRNADALALYFGEDPARCPFEQVVSTLINFVRMFVRAHEENCKQLELEKKKAQKEEESEKLKLGAPKKETESISRSSSSKYTRLR